MEGDRIVGGGNYGGYTIWGGGREILRETH